MKPIKIHTDNDQVQSTITHLENTVYSLNVAIFKAEQLTNSKLDNDAANQIKKDPTTWINTWIDNTTNVAFIDSTMDFKLDSRGLKNTYNDFVDYCQPKIGLWNSIDTVYQNNKFEVKKEVYDAVEKNASLYLTTEPAKVEYEYLVKLAELLNFGFENKHLNILSRPSIVNNINRLKLKVSPAANDFNIVVNPYSLTLDK
jgi:hypothetical protein